MRGKVLSALALGLAAALVGPAAFASAIPVGYISYDVTGTGVAQFDINNETGVNSSGDSTFPVTTSVSLSDLSLDVKFASGPDEIFGSSYFTLSRRNLLDRCPFVDRNWTAQRPSRSHLCDTYR